MAYLGRDDRDFIVELTVLVNGNTPLAVAKGMTMELIQTVSDAAEKEVSIHVPSTSQAYPSIHRASGQESSDPRC